MEVARARADAQIERRHGFEIVIEDVGPGFDDLLERAILAQEIGRQHFDRRRRRGAADGADDLRKMCRTAIVEIVAVDRGDDRMRQTHAGDGVGHLLGLVRIERTRQARSSHCRRRRPACRCRP